MPQVTIPAKELARAQSMLLPLAKKSPKPILECVLLEASEQRITLTANNLEASAAILLSGCEVEGEIKAAIPAERFFRNAKQMLSSPRSQFR